MRGSPSALELPDWKLKISFGPVGELRRGEIRKHNAAGNERHALFYVSKVVKQT